jgi:hypothetical protein
MVEIRRETDSRAWVEGQLDKPQYSSARNS